MVTCTVVICKQAYLQPIALDGSLAGEIYHSIFVCGDLGFVLEH
jgi:hypothetical protein